MRHLLLRLLFALLKNYDILLLSRSRGSNAVYVCLELVTANLLPIDVVTHLAASEVTSLEESLPQ